MTDTSMAEDPPLAGDDTGGDAGDESHVIVTILMKGDGTFVLFDGDEPEEGEAGAQEAPGAAPPEVGAGGAAPPPVAGPPGAPPVGAEAGPGAPEVPQGEPFDNVADLLKAVLEIVQEAAKGGGEDQGFDQGFDEASKSEEAAPPIRPMQGP
jgi:hypothetical protein